MLDDAAQRELTASVQSLGILQPIAVRYVETDDIYQIISGERRYQAAKAAGLTELPCWVQNPKDDEILVRQIVENWQRAQLHPFELADSLARLRGTNGYSQKQLADVTGKSAGEISKLMSLLDLSPQLQKESREDLTGAITKRHLYAISKLEPDEQQEALSSIRDGRLTAVETDRMVSRTIASRRGPRKRGAPVTRFHYVTSEATVLVTFRRLTAGTEDVLGALREACEKIEKAQSPTEVRIVRPK